MDEDRTAPEQLPERRLTVSDAALELGLSAEAVLSRIKRGTLRNTKEANTVYVLLPADHTTTGHDQTTYQTSARTGARGAAQEDLVDSLLDLVAYTRAQLAEEREARRRADT